MNIIISHQHKVLPDDVMTKWTHAKSQQIYLRYQTLGLENNIALEKFNITGDILLRILIEVQKSVIFYGNFYTVGTEIKKALSWCLYFLYRVIIPYDSTWEGYVGWICLFYFGSSCTYLTICENIANTILVVLIEFNPRRIILSVRVNLGINCIYLYKSNATCNITIWSTLV